MEQLWCEICGFWTYHDENDHYNKPPKKVDMVELRKEFPNIGKCDNCGKDLKVCNCFPGEK